MRQLSCNPSHRLLVRSQTCLRSYTLYQTSDGWPGVTVESIDWFVYCKPPPPCKASDIGVIEQVLRATLAFDTAQGGSEAEEAGRKALMVLNSKPPAFFDYVAVRSILGRRWMRGVADRTSHIACSSPTARWPGSSIP